MDILDAIRSILGCISWHVLQHSNIPTFIISEHHSFGHQRNISALIAVYGNKGGGPKEAGSEGLRGKMEQCLLYIIYIYIILFMSPECYYVP